MHDDCGDEIRCGTFDDRAQALVAELRCQEVPEWRAFGDYLRAVRVELRITLREAAARAGMEPADYSAIECGRAKPPEDVGALLDRLGVVRGGEVECRLCVLAEVARNTEWDPKRPGETRTLKRCEVCGFRTWHGRDGCLRCAAGQSERWNV